MRGQHQRRKAAFKDLCTRCSLRQRCTKAKAGRILTIRPHHDLQARRPPQKPPPDPTARPTTAVGDHQSNAPLPVSSSMATATSTTAAPSPTMPGHTRVAALNLRRLINLGLSRIGGTWTIAPATAWAEGPSDLRPDSPSVRSL
ncbi:transposase [Streptomyces sp. NPDC007991]|uniref:transposase n=1 Tax=Streptomyces sp. NPDC007991 TaxID=3364803 RepID=UPI0036ED83BE